MCKATLLSPCIKEYICLVSPILVLLTPLASSLSIQCSMSELSPLRDISKDDKDDLTCCIPSWVPEDVASFLHNLYLLRNKWGATRNGELLLIDVIGGEAT